jgi:phage baseplate assembly protein W
MAIKISSLKNTDLVQKSLDNNYLYKDLKLDLEPNVYFNRQLNKKESLKDLAVIYDIEAIKNSIETAFLTAPGDKILNPTYGLDLRQYIFEPIDDFTTDIIKDDIETKLPIMEPRVTVENVEVIGDEDDNTYYINLQINVPSLGVTGLSIKSKLNSTGYSIV